MPARDGLLAELGETHTAIGTGSECRRTIRLAFGIGRHIGAVGTCREPAVLSARKHIVEIARAILITLDGQEASVIEGISAQPTAEIGLDASIARARRQRADSQCDQKNTLEPDATNHSLTSLEQSCARARRIATESTPLCAQKRVLGRSRCGKAIGRSAVPTPASVLGSTCL